MKMGAHIIPVVSVVVDGGKTNARVTRGHLEMIPGFGYCCCELQTIPHL